ncbi:MAG: short-chain dehydrogenase/reductase [Fibrobacteres bacterium]|nr:short-chain dehydrogenase/reductase [Fibrobacterota bacterium]
MENLKGRIVLFGATSGIASAVAARLASLGEALILIGRDGAALEAQARALESAHGRKPACLAWDVLDFAGHADRFRQLEAMPAAREGGIQGVFFAAGILFPQDECDRDPDKTRLTIETNLTGPAMILDLFAGHFRRRGSGWISCVSSVAGDRGRGKVLAYAAAKAGLSAYLAGLRHRLVGTGVFVQTVKPGFVRTRMTKGVESRLMAEPEKVAQEIVSALRKRREVLYTPGIWRWIMLIIRWIPSPVFRRMKL